MIIVLPLGWIPLQRSFEIVPPEIRVGIRQQQVFPLGDNVQNANWQLSDLILPPGPSNQQNAKQKQDGDRYQENAVLFLVSVTQSVTQFVCALNRLLCPIGQENDMVEARLTVDEYMLLFNITI
ncbi:hypothetical protein F2P81_003773 [Scophthalmus maximus]|uniref:Uncharacterized protein n=1 Tax=Scophthalmus maximus TaxID=52904 RepID=A0A6A4THA9_SCOMX|nr:hypothetical protein F2P81_003773 [Scophthalmus maximus]